MDDVLCYRFDEIDNVVRRDIHATSVRLNTALQELRSAVAPLLQVWTRDAATAYQIEQRRWHGAAAALNDILVALGTAVGDGATDLAQADRRAAGSWGR